MSENATSGPRKTFEMFKWDKHCRRRAAPALPRASFKKSVARTGSPVARTDLSRLFNREGYDATSDRTAGSGVEKLMGHDMPPSGRDSWAPRETAPNRKVA